MRFPTLLAIIATQHICINADTSANSASQPTTNSHVEAGNALPLPDKERFIRAPVYLQRAMLDADEGTNKDAAYLVGLAYYYGDGVTLNYEDALQYFKKAAQNGHPQAAINVGYMYYNGIGATKDYNAAFGYYSIAANQDDPEGCYRAGSMLYAGEGHLNSQDRQAETARAFQFLSRAVEHNITGSRVLLGSLWEYGTFETGSNFTKARLLYEAGCSRDEGECCYHLALMYAYARGVHQDYEHALRLFKHTFERHAHGPSAYYLGIMHANAQGVMLNYPLARYYLLKAVESGDIRTLGSANSTYTQLNGFMEYATGMAESRGKAMRMAMGTSEDSSQAALYGIPRVPKR